MSNDAAQLVSHWGVMIQNVISVVFQHPDWTPFSFKMFC